MSSMFYGEELVDRDKKPKIAILMFGQPRFIEKTYTYILEEFDIPGCEVHFFGHFWESIGYTPEDEKKDNLEKACKIGKLLPFKEIMIEDNKKLNNACKCMQKFNALCDYTIPWPDNTDDFRYYIGQHYSTKECYKQIIGYEKQNNFNYDTIIKIRTDVLYKNKLCYASEDDYIRAKHMNYAWLPYKHPYVRCNVIRILDLHGENIHDIKKFYNDKYVTLTNEIKDSNLSYTRRLAINDWMLVANRSAAHIFYNNWFTNILATWYEDFHNKLKVSNHFSELNSYFIPKLHAKHRDQKWLIRSEQSIQGSIIRYNNIIAEAIERRDTKVYDITREKNNVINEHNINIKLPIQEQLQKRFPIK